MRISDWSSDVCSSDLPLPVLPAVMREGAVGFRHAMRVFALLDGVAAIIGCIHQLTRKTGGHGILRAVARSAYQPADGKRLGAVRADLDRHLIGRTTDAAAADLDEIGRAHV